MGSLVPTHYIVLHDTSTMEPDHVQRITFKMCHLYFNWPGTVRVPAPCQYAHKLAFLIGSSVKKEHDICLADKLFFLWIFKFTFYVVYNIIHFEKFFCFLILILTGLWSEHFLSCSNCFVLLLRFEALNINHFYVKWKLIVHKTYFSQESDRSLFFYILVSSSTT